MEHTEKYFTESIRGGRSDASLYQELIKKIKETATVLTEHIGNPSLSITESSSDVDIYVQDTTWLKESDLVIAECTNPSLGVGYELAYAEKLNKPVHILYRPNDSNLSAMLKGNSYFHIHTYNTKEEALKIIESILKN